MEKKKLITILVLTVTLVLTLIAVFTALKLYQVGKKPVTTPSPSPTAVPPEIFQVEEEGPCELTFDLQATPTPTPPPTETPTPTPPPTETPTPTPTPVPGCWETCEDDSQCPSELSCEQIDGIYRCVNPDCPEESDCICLEETPTPTPGATPTPAPEETPLPPGVTPTPVPGATPAPELPTAGVVSPTVAFSLGGILLILLGLLF